MNSRKYDALNGPFETDNRKEAFEVMRKALKKFDVKLYKIYSRNVSGMKVIHFTGTYKKNGASFYSSIEDRTKVKQIRGLDFTLPDISLAMVKESK